MQDQPNLIYILADDMGYGDVSALNPQAGFQTPCLDEMARNGMRFTDAHASAAVCTPSRYSLLTGRYNWRSRLKSSVTGGYSEPVIEDGRRTIAAMLQGAGYYTAAIGKWHLGMRFAREAGFEEHPDHSYSDGVDYEAPIKCSPIHYGFDEYFGISASLDMPPYVYIENDHFTAIPDHMTEDTGKRFYRKGPTAPGFVHEHVLDELTQRALTIIENHADEPFFLYFPLPAPHTPILPAEKFQGKSGTNEYGDFCLHVDDVVGRINNKLKELNLFENSILIFASDNGCSPMADYPELLARGHNPSYIFRGTKADIYEGGHRVPLFVQWPGVVPANSECSRLVCLCDLMATMSEVLHIPLGEADAVDSVSMLSILKDPQAPEVRDDLVHQSIDGSLSLRKGHFKLEMCPGSGGWSDPKPGEETLDMPRFQLYDLEKDIGETTNVIEQYPEEAKRMRAILKEHVINGRTTPGPRQENTGEKVWDTVLWLLEDADS